METMEFLVRYSRLPSAPVIAIAIMIATETFIVSDEVASNLSQDALVRGFRPKTTASSPMEKVGWPSLATEGSQRDHFP